MHGPSHLPEHNTQSVSLESDTLPASQNAVPPAGVTRGRKLAAETEQVFIDAERALRAADPDAFLVLPRVLRRVIRFDCELPALALQIPHRKSYTIRREKLREIVALDELGIENPRELPEVVILISRPDEHELAGMTTAGLRSTLWRLLFHARVHRTLERAVTAGRFGKGALRRRVDRIGQAEFDEIQSVLQQEHFLLPPYNQLHAYIEFAAVYLELQYFAPHWLSAYFPCLIDLARIDALLAEDVDAVQLFQTTRLEGAVDPADLMADAAEVELSVRPLLEQAGPDRPASRWRRRRLERAAARARVRGNHVLAGVLWLRLARSTPAALDSTERSDCEREAAADLETLVTRLQAALDIPAEQTGAWRTFLDQLLQRALEGFWNAERRLLYDLQKVCVDHERESYVIDLVVWAFSLGRRPIKRPLPNQREVLIAQHLRSAIRRLPKTRLSAVERSGFSVLLHDAQHGAAERLRANLRPVLADTLQGVGMVPRNLPERVALAKLVEELLDGVLQRDFFTMGHLRDAVSRNNLKLDDLAGIREFFGGDPLLRADRRLAVALDGVYRPGEFYLRWLQSLSSLAFGTRPGRFLTQYVVIPFGGAYVALEGLNHLLHIVAEQLWDSHPNVMHPAIVVGLGLFLLGMLHHATFRRVVIDTLLSFYHVFRGLLVDIPGWVMRMTLLRELWRSAPLKLVRRYLLFPLFLTGLIALAWPLLGSSQQMSLPVAAIIFVVLTAAVNSRVGRDIEEVAVESIERLWYRIRVRIFVALFELIMETFKRMLEGFERLLYAVDEWLRFKSGESALSLGTKAVLGVVWSAATFVIRFCVNLLIEPQINPIKHFPVVTVSHKVILPTQPFIARLMTPTLGKVWANTVSATTVFLLPGVCGFLVWELKENWRLYAANRRRQLYPVMVGSHGETMGRLMKPGLHSGTIPKIFAKLRRAERIGNAARRTHLREKYQERLRHVTEAVQHLIERELLNLLSASPAWGGLRLEVGKVEVTPSILQIELCSPDLAGLSVWLGFQEQSRLLVAGLAAQGWLRDLQPWQRDAFIAALCGLYKTAGVDLVREQIERCFAPRVWAYDVREHELVIWPDGRFETEITYDLRQRPFLEPRPNNAALQYGLPPLEPVRLIYRETPIKWSDWVAAWDQNEADSTPPRPLLDAARVLPPLEQIPLTTLG